MFYKNKKAQSILEYALLLGVIIAAIMIMQVFVKRGFQGGLKESADRMGEQFSAGSTTILQSRNLTDNQTIREEAGTTEVTNTTLEALGHSGAAVGTVGIGVYSFTDRSGNQTTNTTQLTDAAKAEKFRWSEYDNTTWQNFNSTLTEENLKEVK